MQPAHFGSSGQHNDYSTRSTQASSPGTARGSSANQNGPDATFQNDTNAALFDIFSGFDPSSSQPESVFGRARLSRRPAQPKPQLESKSESTDARVNKQSSAVYSNPSSTTSTNPTPNPTPATITTSTTSTSSSEISEATKAAQIRFLADCVTALNHEVLLPTPQMLSTVGSNGNTVTCHVYKTNDIDVKFVDGAILINGKQLKDSQSSPLRFTKNTFIFITEKEGMYAVCTREFNQSSARPTALNFSMYSSNGAYRDPRLYGFEILKEIEKLGL